LKFIYDFLILFTETIALPLVGLFSKKLKKFSSGRKTLFKELTTANLIHQKIVWFHAASLGEYEQGLPIMQEILKEYPDYKLLVTFFSPSGYEVKKHNSIADYVFYLPLDTPKNAKKFIQLVQPELAVFIKYEIWPNFLTELKQHQIPSLLISGVFRSNQIYFKSYGKFLLNAVKSFNYLFVQNEESLQSLKENKVHNAMVSGDTRFDRVFLQTKMDNSLSFVQNFKNNLPCIVFGSTWPEGEEYISTYINETSHRVKYIIAPHQIHSEKINQLKNNIHKKVILYSEFKDQHIDLKEYDVLLLDTIGLLTKVYSEATIAYVGGAIGTTGLHNILEPAVFGAPLIIGNHFEKFPEAKILQKLEGLTAISNYREFKNELNTLVQNESFRTKKGQICKDFILSNTGATNKVMSYISREKLL
tara:strand:+ start:4584 stop:5837 length:1254 start_codon:yes stop_codon:yes gene_type:complete